MVQEAYQERLYIDTEGDILTVRKKVRDASVQLGFNPTDVTRIVTAASELARNVFRFAGTGEMRWNAIQNGRFNGLELCFEDKGPGIPNVEQAMERGYTTGGGLGLGLPGTKRLMDEMEIDTAVGRGTTIVVRKWLHQ